ncbi:MAG: hypothetical protein KKB50_09110, partial [Planctomycetes bacterium]|nr:hypothetical protein [Planctomycetota bacterium]
ETAFYWWRRELARRDAERKPAARHHARRAVASFLPVHVSAEPARDGDPSDGDQPRGGWQIEVVLTDGRRVRLIGPVNQRVLPAVLEALHSTGSVAAEQRAC